MRTEDRIQGLISACCTDVVSLIYNPQPLVYLAGYHYVAKVGLKLLVLLFPECSNYKCALSWQSHGSRRQEEREK